MRVYCAFVCRKATEPGTVKLVLFVVLTGVTVSFVSIRNVVLNAPLLELEYFIEFSHYAFTHTELPAKIASIGFLGLLGWIGKDAVNSLRYRKDRQLQEA